MSYNSRSAGTLPLGSPVPERLRTAVHKELDKARAEVEAVKADAAAARERAEQARIKLLKSNRDAKVRLRATAAIMMTGALIKMAWQATQAPSPVPTPITVPPSPSSAAAPSAVSAPPSPDAAGGADQSAGALAMERLLTAFHSFPEEDQPDIVREVNAKHWSDSTTCPFAWNDAGKPSLYVGSEKKDTPVPLLANALNQCASGVERLRAERDAVAGR